MFKNFFNDKNGNKVIAQKPNAPLIVWALSTLVSIVNVSPQITAFLELISFGALFTWAWMEIFQGDSMFRRVLGSVVMTLLIISRL